MSVGDQTSAGNGLSKKILGEGATATVNRVGGQKKIKTGSSWVNDYYVAINCAQ